MKRRQKRPVSEASGGQVGQRPSRRENLCSCFFELHWKRGLSGASCHLLPFWPVIVMQRARYKSAKIMNSKSPSFCIYGARIKHGILFYFCVDCIPAFNPRYMLCWLHIRQRRMLSRRLMRPRFYLLSLLRSPFSLHPLRLRKLGAKCNQTAVSSPEVTV